ncbi:MAG: hypothetical protein MJH10_19995 [Epibacterium sp.]|nr:hypothetical protein [Epibacterium sp.]NQX75762.1 hypothetical protein [Epibacterium sp.]
MSSMDVVAAVFSEYNTEAVEKLRRHLRAEVDRITIAEGCGARLDDADQMLAFVNDCCRLIDSGAVDGLGNASNGAYRALLDVSKVAFKARAAALDDEECWAELEKIENMADRAVNEIDEAEGRKPRTDMPKAGAA